jgi:hypothetical protein
MTDGIDTNEIERRARAASFEDGLMELFAALVLVTIAMAWVASPAFVGIVAALIVLYGWRLMERIKRRITYPRIGYYQERSEDAATTGRGMLVFLACAVAVMIAAIAVFGDLTVASEWRRAAPLLSGLSLAGGFWYAGDRSGLLRHRVISVYSVVSGVLLWAFSSGATYEPVVWHLLGMALPLAAIGAWALERFLRTHHLSDGTVDA